MWKSGKYKHIKKCKQNYLQKMKNILDETLKENTFLKTIAKEKEETIKEK